MYRNYLQRFAFKSSNAPDAQRGRTIFTPTRYNLED